MFSQTANKYTFFTVFLLLLLVYLNSCNQGTASNKMKEGEIEFEIEYLDNERENPLISLLPRKMITAFKNNNSHSLIEGFFGTFKLVYISNYQKGKNVTLFQILDKKYMYHADTSASPFGYQTDTDLKLVHTDKIKNIAGYECENAMAIFPDLKDTIQLYFTHELGIKNPNSNNPYKSIDGVLLAFSVKLLGINMKFRAKKIKAGKVDSEKFNIPDGYKKVSKSEMEKIMNEYNKVSDK